MDLEELSQTNLLRKLMALRIAEATHNRNWAHKTKLSATERAEVTNYNLGRLEQCQEILSLLDGKIETIPTWDEYRASR